MAKISGVIITYNEEKNIARCIESMIDVVDEIVIVDSLSTDKTKQIALNYNVRFIEQPFLGYIAQKNFAMKQAKYDYILHLDADEQLSSKAKESILQIKQNLEDYDAYSFNRRTWFIDKFINYGDWYPDKKIRLWNRQKGQWTGYDPHDYVRMQPKTKIKHLKGDILHYSFNSWNEYLNQTNKFIQIKVQSLLKKGKKGSYIGLIFGPAFTFFRAYFLKLGFLDGLYGFIIAFTSAYANFQKYAGLLLKSRK